MYNAKRLLPLCEAVVQRSPTKVLERSKPVLTNDLIVRTKNGGDLSGKVKYQLKQHIDDFFDIVSDILQLTQKDRRKASRYRKFGFLKAKDIKLSTAVPLAESDCSQIAYALFQRDSFFNCQIEAFLIKSTCPIRQRTGGFTHFRLCRLQATGGEMLGFSRLKHADTWQLHENVTDSFLASINKHDRPSAQSSNTHEHSQANIHSKKAEITKESDLETPSQQSARTTNNQSHDAIHCSACFE
ncbi:hypothetical protein Tcan_13004 [Toxocara canis]|uniref:Uncharacterized protein n=1 Tax=Toxocara canis TaxID=6265 RepID=A0A0B2V7K9_TOXCA|nr:hypothetical protein Tcan_13004 [Toxocara canis]